MAQVAFPLTPQPGETNLADNLSPIIEFPDEIKLNEINQIRVLNFTDRQRIVLTDGNIATFDPETLLVTARKLGCFEIQVLERKKRQPSGAALAPSVVATKSVNVIL